MTFPSPPARDPRQRRHSTKTVQLARQMYDGGWTPAQIRRYLAKDGIKVSLHTVRCWAIPGIADEHRERNRLSYHRRRGDTPASSKTPVLDRMLALRGAGLSFTAIGRVVRLDVGLELSTDQVRYYVNERREPERPKRLVAA